MTSYPSWSAMTKAEKSAAIAAGVAAFMSAGEIGQRHGCTRNVIIGHSHRYGPKLTAPRVATADVKTLRSERHYRTYVPRPRSKPRPRKALQPRVQAPPLVPAQIHQTEPLAAPVTFLARPSWQCVWPTGGGWGPNLLCCGQPVARKYVTDPEWCEAHQRHGHVLKAGRHLLTLERGEAA